MASNQLINRLRLKKSFLLFVGLVLSAQLGLCVIDANAKDDEHDYDHLEAPRKCGSKDDINRVYSQKIAKSNNACCLEHDDIFNRQCAHSLKTDSIDDLYDKNNKFDKNGKSLIKALNTPGYKACLNYNTQRACPENAVCFADASRGNATSCAMRRLGVVSKDAIVAAAIALNPDLTFESIKLSQILEVKKNVENFISKEFIAKGEEPTDEQVNNLIETALKEEVETIKPRMNRINVIMHTCEPGMQYNIGYNTCMSWNVQYEDNNFCKFIDYSGSEDKSAEIANYSETYRQNVSCCISIGKESELDEGEKPNYKNGFECRMYNPQIDGDRIWPYIVEEEKADKYPDCTEELLERVECGEKKLCKVKDPSGLKLIYEELGWKNCKPCPKTVDINCGEQIPACIQSNGFIREPSKGAKGCAVCSKELFASVDCGAPLSCKNEAMASSWGVNSVSVHGTKGCESCSKYSVEMIDSKENIGCVSDGVYCALTVNKYSNKLDYDCDKHALYTY